MNICNRIRTARESLALSQPEAATKFGIPVSTYRKYETGPSEPGSQALAGITRAGINANWLLTGEGPMLLADLAKPGEVSAGRVYAPIPRHVIIGKDGVETDVPSEIESLALSLDWLSQRGLRPVDLTYVRMPDDSMYPTIRAGAMIVMDSSSDKFRGDGIYGLIHNGDAAVKRLQKNFGGGLYIRSDNPAYREQLLPDDQVDRLFIIGKAIWTGGEI